MILRILTDLVLFASVCSIPAWAVNSCAVVATSPTVALPSGTASTWTSCGGTVPQNGDSVTVGYLLQINSNIPASGSLASLVVNGTNAQVSWDGHSHTVAVTGQIQVELGCLVVGADCPTGLAWDTATTLPVVASATGTASNGGTTLSVAGVTGTLENGMVVECSGIAPGTTVNGSGASWTLSIATYAAVSGPCAFSAAISYEATGLTSGQGVFAVVATVPSYTTYGKVYYFVASPGASGGMFYDPGAGTGTLTSDTWAFGYGTVIGGIKSFVPLWLGSFTLLNITVSGNADSVAYSNIDAPTISETATGSTLSKTLTAISGTYGVFGIAVGQTVTDSTTPSNIPAGTTVTSTSLYPAGTTATISNFPAANFSGDTLVFTENLVATNVTQVNSTSTSFMFYGADAVHPWVITNPAVLTDAAGTYTTTLAGDGATISGALILAYWAKSSNNQAPCITLTPGMTVSNSAISGCYSDIYAGPGSLASPVSVTGNFVSNVANALGTGGPGGQQGSIFAYGPGPGDCTIQSNVIVSDGNFGIPLYIIGDTAGENPTCVVDHNTVVSYPGQGSSVQVIGLGEGTVPGNECALCQVSNNIIVNGGIGVQAVNSTFVTSLIASAGVGYNDVYGQTALAFGGQNGSSPCGPCGNGYDNGTTAQGIGSTYKEIAINPNFVNGAQYSVIDTRWAACDTVNGTVANMFQTEMAGQAVYGFTPGYTTAQVVTCLRSAFTPTNPLATHTSSTGSYIGAVPPLIMSSGAAGLLLSQ